MFGIVTVARAVPCAKEMDAIVETAKTYLAEEFAKARTFKVESRRADKQFPMNSIQISQYVGGELGQFFNVKADMHHPDLTVYVEIREKYAYIHTPSVPGAGRSAHRYGRPGGEPAFRRSGQPRFLLYDRPPGRGAGNGALCFSPVYLPAGAGQGAGAGPAADGVLRPDDRPHHPLPRKFRRRSAASAPRNTLPSSCAGL